MEEKKVLLDEGNEDDQQLFLDFFQSQEDIILLPIAADGVVLFAYANRIREKTEQPLVADPRYDLLRLCG